MPSLPIEERLLHYFLAMGAQLVEPLENGPSGLTVSLGPEKVHIAIMKNDAFLQRGKFIESLLNLISLRDSADQLYLAAPRLLGTAIDAQVFRSYGIGLLLFDDRRIDETLAPLSFHPQNHGVSGESLDSALMTELAALKSKYMEMEKTVARLREGLESFQEAIVSTTFNTETMSPARIQRQETKFTGSSVKLPSFFTNNPWLEVLSKRGREEAAPIAA